MTKTFIMFRDGRRLRAAHAQLARLDAPILVDGRRFNPAGGFTHWSHITDAKKRLVGFAVQSLEHANSSTEWRAWWDSFDNRILEEFFEALLFFTETIPTDWHHDCALLVGGWVYSDGAGDFALGIPDENGYCFKPSEPTQFWTDIGFEVARCTVSSAE